MDFHIWLTIPGHQKHSLSSDRVWLQPWCLASLWHPFKMVMQWAFRTTNSRKFSVLPLGVEGRYKAPWWTIKFGQFCRIILPSLLEALSARRAFKSVLFWAFSQSNTALSAGFSLWASAQSVTCICTRMQHAVTHTSCSKWWALSTTVG